jgi:hypothetical protein
MQLKRGHLPGEAVRVFSCAEMEMTNRPMTDVGRRYVIVGGGFSGSLLAVHLLRRSPLADRVFLIERNAAFGRGVA